MFNAMEGIAGKYDAMTWPMVLSGCVLFSLIALHYLTLIRCSFGVVFDLR